MLFVTAALNQKQGGMSTGKKRGPEGPFRDVMNKRIAVLQRILICVLYQVGQIRFGQDLLGTQIMPFTDVILRGQ